MQKEKHVRIDLPSEDGSSMDDLPIKFKKSKRSPSAHNFKVVPAASHQIQELVQKVVWDSHDKTLYFEIKENVHFDVYKWIELIRRTYAETQKGPFVDLEQDSIMIHFLDHLGHEVFTLRFKELKLLDHNVNLEQKHNLNGHEDMIHVIKIQYNDSESVDIRELFEWNPQRDDNEDTDEEWQTVEK
jgi:hypothetical protein